MEGQQKYRKTGRLPNGKEIDPDQTAQQVTLEDQSTLIPSPTLILPCWRRLRNKLNSARFYRCGLGDWIMSDGSMMLGRGTGGCS